MKPIAEIIFDEIKGSHGDLGLITLSRQQALNALNHDMFIALDEQLSVWEKNENIKAVIIQAAEGRAFSAGGDIRHAYERKLAGDPKLFEFFRDEYHMNARIRHFPKPYIALLNGITMGGGVGVSIHGSNRVGTDRFVFAMPETGIGFYPDVGTTYVLSRLPYQMGFYLGLTGARISYSDCLAIGIVQIIVAADSFPNIIVELTNAALPNKEAVNQLLQKFAIGSPSSELLTHRQEIATCFAKDTIEEILAALKDSSSEWCHKTAETIQAKSPTSLKVTLLALQKAKNYTFDECMQMEYRLTCHFIEGHDFFEGIRAAIIDKDQKPQWVPAKLSEVTESMVEQYFSPVTEDA